MTTSAFAGAEGLAGAQPHTRSGKFGLRLIPVILIAAAVTGVLGAIYGFMTYINPFVYFNVIAFGIVCVVASVVAERAVVSGHSRNAGISALAGALIGLTALYGAWVVFCVQLFSSDEGTLDIVTVIQSPEMIWNAAQLVASLGYYEIFGFTPKGIVLWAIWGIEAIGLVGVPALMAVGHTTTHVYCEDCGAWAEVEDGLLEFHHPDPQQVATEFERGSVRYLADAVQADPRSAGFFRIDGEDCKDNGGVSALSLRVITREWEDDEKFKDSETTLFEDLIVPQSTYNAVQSASLPAAPAADAAQPSEAPPASLAEH